MTASRNIIRKHVPFDDNIVVEDCGFTSPCHIWKGNISDTGYGRYGDGGVSHLTHRYAYVRAYGEIPDGLSIDHLCRVCACVNPDHLEAVTLAENTRRQMQVLGPIRASARAKRVRCRNGHEVDGGKPCAECLRNARARWRAKNPGYVSPNIRREG